MPSSIPSVIEQQTRWAKGRGLEAKNAYLASVSDNLRDGELSVRTEKEFRKGDGGELREGGVRPAKMRALRSSAALAVNVFDYWRSPRDAAPLQQALELTDRITEICFEQPFSTRLPGHPPNLDVVIALEGGGKIAIESKFTEWLSPRKLSFDPKYFPVEKDLWSSKGLPNCQALAAGFSEPEPFRFLNVPQLLKHALGLAGKKKEGANELWYIYFDWKCPERVTHAEELKRFADLVGEEIPFRALTYQDLFCRLQSTIQPEDAPYLEYLQDRYPAAQRPKLREALHASTCPEE
jgi:hypothetical protein